MKPIVYIETKENGYIFRMGLKPYFSIGYETYARYRIVYQYYKDSLFGKLFKKWHNLYYNINLFEEVSWHYKDENYETPKNKIIDLYGSIDKIRNFQKECVVSANRYKEESRKVYLDRTTHPHLKQKNENTPY